VQRLGYTGAPKLNFLVRFDQNAEYKRPAGAFCLARFSYNLQSLYRVPGALAAKISLDFLKGLRSYGAFNLMVSG